ncbi:uncharacterized protein LOC133205775 [Saccostrea echinata]|uniref:uncharacterized protein LOC133205775 n=1 Tax=Saccostrea echinata TaxID=191078 RepID=UPI002A809EBA|nr:uncharacterized protein LOC133205775 [Saccostrea echinata]
MCRWSVVFVLFSAVCGAVWKPSVHDTWQWELSSGHIVTSVNAHVFDIDLFDADQSAIDKLHSMGRKVICYFSAGSYENWRPDKNEFPSDVLGNNLEDWEGEKWLDIRDDRVKAIMRKRLDKAISRRCDGVEPDNVDGYSNNNGLGLKASDQLSYNK